MKPNKLVMYLGTHKQISKKKCDFSNKNENLAIFENLNMNNFEHM
jgi:hypothetical protein